MNCAFFLNQLRRKQAIIGLKKELLQAIEARDKSTTVMREQIKNSIEIYKEAAAELEIDQQIIVNPH